MRRAASIALAVLIAAAPAAARDAFEVGAWIGGSQASAQGRFQRCTAETSYWNGAVLQYALDRRAVVTMTARHPRWRFRPGRQLRVSYALNGGQPLAATARADGPNGVRLTLSADSWGRTARARKLTLRTPQGSFVYDLGRIAAVLRRLLDCMKRERTADLRRFGRTQAQARGAGPRAARGGAGRNPGGARGLLRGPNAQGEAANLDQHEARVRARGPAFRRAAVRVVRKALDRAGLTQFSVRSRSELGKTYASNRITWADKGSRVIGHLTIFPDPASRTHSIATKSAIEWARRKCGAGRFGTGIRKLGPRDNPIAVRYFLTCDGGKPDFRASLTIFPVRGGFYVVEHYTRSKDEDFWRIDNAFYAAILRMLPRRRQASGDATSLR